MLTKSKRSLIMSLHYIVLSATLGYNHLQYFNMQIYKHLQTVYAC